MKSALWIQDGVWRFVRLVSHLLLSTACPLGQAGRRRTCFGRFADRDQWSMSTIRLRTKIIGWKGWKRIRREIKLKLKYRNSFPSNVPAAFDRPFDARFAVACPGNHKRRKKRNEKELVETWWKNVMTHAVTTSRKERQNEFSNRKKKKKDRPKKKKSMTTVNWTQNQWYVDEL